MKTKTLKDIKTVADVDGLNSIEVRTIASQLKIKNVSKFKKDELVDQIKKEIQLRVDADKAIAETDVQDLRETTSKLGDEAAAEVAAKADIEKENATPAPKVTKKETPKAEKPAKEEKKETPKEEKPKTEKKEIVKKEPKAPKTLPNPESKSMIIYDMLMKGDKSLYAIAKELDTYYSVVDRVNKRYVLPAKAATEAKAKK